MSEYNPCSQCGYDSSAYKALKETRDELVTLTKDLLSSIQNSRKGSVGSMDNVYICQLGVERINKLAEALKEKENIYP